MNDLILKNKGTWKEVGKSGVVGTHAALLHTNQVLFFTRPEEVSHKWNTLDNGLVGDGERQPNDRDVTLSTVVDIYGSSAFEPIAAQVTHNPFCAGHTFLPDGSLLVAGGDKKDTNHHGAPLNTVYGLNSLRIFNPTSGEWKYIGDMSDSRWYPTCTLLADGTVFIISGNLDDMATYNDQNPTCETIPPSSPGEAQFLHFLVEAYPYHSYPFIFVLPSGELFVFVKDNSYFLKRSKDDWNKDRWFVKNGPKLVGRRDDNGQITEEAAKHYPNSATAVLLPLLPKDDYQAKIMIIGGAGANIYPQWADNIIPGFNSKTHEIDAVNNCFRIETDSQNPGSGRLEDTEPMKNPRVMPDAVLLPDGKVFVVNGASKGFAGGNAATGPMLPKYAVKEAEIYDPVKNEWETLAEAQHSRLYHSTALLLPDARILVAGSDHQNNAFIPVDLGGGEEGKKAVALGYEYRMEVFSPPYLSGDVPRPAFELASNNNNISYGEFFEISINNLPELKLDKLAACLISPGAVTHGNNMSQRYVGLKIVRKSETVLRLEAPPDGNIAPPAYYMLFLLYNGIPSKAKFVRLLPKPSRSGEEIQPPTDGAALWLRADTGVVADANCNVYSWADLSGQAMDLYWTPNVKNKPTSPEPKQRPPKLIHNELNGQPVIRFTLIQFYEAQWGGYLKTLKSFILGSDSYAIFIVVHRLPSGQVGPLENGMDQGMGTPGLIGWGNTASAENKNSLVALRFGPGPRSQNPPDGIWKNHLPKYPGRASVVTYWGEKQIGDDLSAPVPMSKAVLLETSFDGLRCRMKLNGESLTESECAEEKHTLEGPLTVGRTLAANGKLGDFFRGDIAEILIYNRNIDDEERGQIQEYLRRRYALW